METFELSWRDKPCSSSAALMGDCCGYVPGACPADLADVADRALGASTVAGTVLRAGDSVPILRLGLKPQDTAAWTTFRSERLKLGCRICYCSVFNEC